MLCSCNILSLSSLSHMFEIICRRFPHSLRQAFQVVRSQWSRSAACFKKVYPSTLYLFIFLVCLALVVFLLLFLFFLCKGWLGLRYLLYFVIFSEPHLILIQHTVRGKKFFKDHGKTAEKVCKSFENREFFFFFSSKKNF